MARPGEGGPLIDDGGTLIPDTTVDTTPAELDDDMAALIAMVLALKDLDKSGNLQKAYDEYMKPGRNLAKIKAYIKASDYYVNYNEIARRRAIVKQEQPGVYAQQLEQYLTEQKKRIVAALGAAAWNTEVEKQVRTGFELGLDNDVLDKLISATGKIGVTAGVTGASIEDLQRFANSYGVSSLYDQKYWDDQRQRLFLGETTAKDIQDDVKQKAIGAYPAWAIGFEQGKSLDLQAGWILNMVAKNLGVSATSLTFDDPTVAPFLNYVDPKTNQQVQPAPYLVQTETRRKYFDKFAATPEGTAYLDGLSLRVLQDMGLM
jgi:hypothetical protein